jgi:hypothetical protein
LNCFERAFFIPALQSAEKLEILNKREGHEFQRLKKNSTLSLLLGGAALKTRRRTCFWVAQRFTAAVNTLF